MEYVLKCICLRKESTLKKNPRLKPHFYFDKAEEKLQEELDVVTLLKSNRKLNLLTQVLLKQQHRMLLRFQRKNLIETSSSSSDSDHNNLDTVKLMENKNPMVRLAIYGKIKRMLNEFQGSTLDDTGRNLVRGLFVRKLKDF